MVTRVVFYKENPRPLINALFAFVGRRGFFAFRELNITKESMESKHQLSFDCQIWLFMLVHALDKVSI
ncbi:hypothetical protein A2X44_02820 [candidate division CPR3 bacterium GWF2_35_18]|nr:MAG: hypothetical protein A2X44_02820 [candidate division CPR3 bacterium GWF2_35_18]OGB65956.1 MAG: hypothetical protein A2250_03570 [candidate division CPR3 bacterium RIFOXYA2_FULL_35_13]OGB76276.1 MAG: hypothetical protein A2476_02460 [candidate division CPR3 bacterium RIFOXYC2_FULL_35_7]OGB80502.1 MAG: hypothetical protein A2011_00280 [candidate division CPR3 bacterium GWE2_35_7]